MKSDIDKYKGVSADDNQFISDIKAIVYTAKQKAYQAADLYQVASNWLVGRRIVEQEQQGEERARYGKRVIALASEALTAEFGKGYGLTQIKNFKRFYLLFSHLEVMQAQSSNLDEKGQTLSDQFISKSQTVSDQSNLAIRQTVSAKFELVKILPLNLSRTHYE